MHRCPKTIFSEAQTTILCIPSLIPAKDDKYNATNADGVKDDRSDDDNEEEEEGCLWFARRFSGPASLAKVPAGQGPHKIPEVELYPG